MGARWKEGATDAEGSRGRRCEELLLLDEIARMGARRMLVAALRREADDYVARHGEKRDARGHALVLRNGRLLPAKIDRAYREVNVAPSESSARVD
jgi:putative transposase